MKAFIISKGKELIDLAIITSDILIHAGFSIEVLTTDQNLTSPKFFHQCYYAKNNHDLIKKADQLLINQYDLIVITEDSILKLILNSNLPVHSKVILLPICSAQNFTHIYSKINLSHLFEKKNIRTPAYFVAHSLDDLKTKMHSFKHPMLIKIDASAAGKGIVECNHSSDIDLIASKIKHYPVLVQQKIQGKTIDTSGFFQNGQPIHFDYSSFEKTYLNPHGPSVLRRYYPLSAMNADIFDEISQLGLALGAHGFVNITCILSAIDHKRYYIEADMRPNVWAGFSKYFTTDIASRIKHYFEHGRVLDIKDICSVSNHMSTLLPYYARLSWVELLTNRYHCWKYMDKHIAVVIFLSRWFSYQRLFFVTYLKPYVPIVIWQVFKRLVKMIMRPLKTFPKKPSNKQQTEPNALL